MPVALHRIQNLGKDCDAMLARESLKFAVATYCEMRTLQADAVEDGETWLAADIGRNMRAMREQYDQRAWNRELAVQDAAAN